MYRFDLFISYWIFIWYALHMTGFIYASPKLVLLLALMGDLFFLLFLLLHNTSLQGFVFLLGIILVSKVVPLATVWREKINVLHDLTIVCSVILVYFTYVLLQGENPVDIYASMIEAIRTNTFDREANPGMTLIHELSTFSSSSSRTT